MTDSRQRTQPSQRPQQQQLEPSKPEVKQEVKHSLPPTAGAGDQAPAIYKLPEPIARRGISEDQWRTLKDNLYPGATNESCLMVWDYCKARKLDPMKKPCHIVPMEVTVKERVDGKMTERKEYRDVVMPGIYEYRTTAMRTGLYLGHSTPVYGPPINVLGVENAPEWCAITFYRWNEKAQQRVEFPVVVYFEEICSTKWGDKKGERVANAKWKSSPIQMLTKCTEAAGLREAFPDELGGEHTSDEMEGRVIGDDLPAVITGATHTDIATEALRARMGKAPSPKMDDRVVSQQPAQGKNVPRGELEDDIPWESPKTDKEWIEALKACKTKDEVKKTWANFIDSNADRTDDIIEVEAVMTYLLETLTA